MTNFAALDSRAAGLSGDGVRAAARGGLLLRGRAAGIRICI